MTRLPSGSATVSQSGIPVIGLLTGIWFFKSKNQAACGPRVGWGANTPSLDSAEEPENALSSRKMYCNNYKFTRGIDLNHLTVPSG